MALSVDHSLHFDRPSLMKKIGKEPLLQALWEMMLIRNFEIRAESAYQQGKVGGFFHAYIGQEAIQAAAVSALGKEQWYITSYRCHALALLLGASCQELMAELFGKSSGNAKGRGGSMHFFTKRLLGGFGIVGGQIPIATGAAFTIKYLEKKEEIAVCFLGDGAVAQGAFHEALNLSALWNLPIVFVIENNQWGMGTAVGRAISVEKLAEDKAPGYGIKGYTLDGMDYLHCYGAFLKFYEEIMQTSRPILVECKTERFKGHSISDPGLYRSKEALKLSMQRDPISLLQEDLINMGWLTLDELKKKEKAIKEQVLAALKYAQESPLPSLSSLEEDVFCP